MTEPSVKYSIPVTPKKQSKKKQSKKTKENETFGELLQRSSMFGTLPKKKQSKKTKENETFGELLQRSSMFGTLPKKKQSKKTKSISNKVNKVKSNCLNNTNGINIVNIHGRTEGNPFVIKEGYRIITITKVGNVCPLSYELRDLIKSFYENKDMNIYDHSEKSSLTPQGKSLIKQIKTNFKESANKKFKYQFKLHKAGDMMNNFYFTFKGGPGEFLGITCLNNKREVVETTFIDKSWGDFDLNTLTHKLGPGEYIICSCRGVNSKNNKKKARKLSRNSNSNNSN